MFARVVTSAPIRFFHDLQTYAACVPAAMASFFAFISLLNEFHFYKMCLQEKHQRGFCCWPHRLERRWSPAAPNRGTKSDKKSAGKKRNFADFTVKTILTDKDLRMVNSKKMRGSLGSARYQQDKIIERKHLHKALWWGILDNVDSRRARNADRCR